MADGGTYIDRQTSYDTSFDQLVKDAFPSSEQGWGDWLSGVVGLDDASITEEAFDQGEQFINTEISNGAYIETRLGNDLAALQQAGGEEYQALVDFVRDVRPDNQKELLSVYQKIASPETFTAIVLSQAGIKEADIKSFVEKLGENEVVREKMFNFIESLDAQPGLTGDIESLTERIQANAGVFQDMVQKPDAFFQLAKSDAFDSIITKVTGHIESGGALDQQGMMGLVSGISLQDKASMFMQIGGATDEQIATFQENLQTAVTANPALEGVLDNAIANSIRDGAATGSNVFETLTNSAEVFANFASTQAAETLLTSPNLIDGIVEKAQEKGDAITMDDLKDIGIETTIYHEAGIFAAVNGSTISPAMMMMGGHGIDMMIDQAKKMGDGNSAKFMKDLVSQFPQILSGDGLGGIIGGLGNSPGWLQEAGGLTASRFGFDLGGSSEAFARMDRSLIFDGSDGYLPAIDYEQIGRNYANNVWDAEGKVRPEIPDVNTSVMP
jgi:hypothetical protein